MVVSTASRSIAIAWCFGKWRTTIPVASNSPCATDSMLPRRSTRVLVLVMLRRTDYKYSLVRAVVSLRADAAPYNKITSNMKQAKLLFLLIAALAFASQSRGQIWLNIVKSLIHSISPFWFDSFGSSELSCKDTLFSTDNQANEKVSAKKLLTY